jgi:hypothetical protein
MHPASASCFHFPSFRDGLERLDPDRLGRLLADDAELHEIDHSAPPSAPRVHRGRRAIQQNVRDLADLGLAVQVADEVLGPQRVAFTMHGRYDDKYVVGMTTIHLERGRVTKIVEVKAWDV